MTDLKTLLAAASPLPWELEPNGDITRFSPFTNEWHHIGEMEPADSALTVRMVNAAPLVRACDGLTMDNPKLGEAVANVMKALAKLQEDGK